MNHLMNVHEVAKYLNFSEITIRRWVAANKIPVIKLGKHWRFDPERIAEWLKHNTIGEKQPL